MLDWSYEIIFVNDDSPNKNTSLYLNKCLESDSRVKVITLSKNYGQQAATLCGITESKGTHVITMDDDLQHAPEDIIKLIRYQDHDVVFGQLEHKQHSWWRNIASKVKGYFDCLLIGKPKHLELSSFRLIKRYVVDSMDHSKTPYPFIPALVFGVTLDAVNVPVSHHQRFDGKSTYTLRKMVAVFENLIINNSSYLLSVLGRIGLIFFIGSLLYSGYHIVMKLYGGQPIAGWTSVIAGVFMFGGLNMLSIGIIGKYLIRIIKVSENTPCYVIKSVRSNE